jgi:hypothetical protein
VSLINEHARDIKEVTERLQAAVDDTWKTRGQNRYRAWVHVLLLRWKDDDLGVATEVDALGFIFSKSYHYNVETWEIPNAKPVRELQFRLGEFLTKYDKQDALLIVYYAGHAEQNIRRSEPPIWAS